jgi:hypothetical protein
MDDTISRADAINALWKALYEYEDKTEKQFQESDELDVGDWIVHRIFVQNMSDIDRRTILDLPSAQPEIIRCGQCKYAEVADKEDAQDGYTCQFHRGSIWFSGSYCSWAERKQK